MRRTLLAVLATLLLFASPLHAAEESIENVGWNRVAGNLWHYTVKLTADSADAGLTALVTPDVICGCLVAIYIDPGSPGPTDNSDIVLYPVTPYGNTASHDMLEHAADDKHGDNIVDNTAGNYTHLASEMGEPTCSKISITISNNAVNSAVVYVTFLVRIEGST